MNSIRFFKPEDFYSPGEEDTRKTPLDAAVLANKKLMSLGRVIYGRSNSDTWCPVDLGNSTYKALIINITPVKCKHPTNSISIFKFSDSTYECQLCGAVLKPATFYEVKRG